MADPKYASFDPGVTTGVVLWDAKGVSLRVYQFKQKELSQFLNEDPALKTVEIFIIEEYRVYSHKALAHIGSKLETVQIIGQLKGYAGSKGIEVVEQSARILKIAQMWSGLKIPSDHKQSHWPSAYNHGFYYLRKRGIIKSKLLESKNDL